MGTNYFNRNIRDTKFVLYEYIGMDKILQYDKYKEISEDTINLVLDQAIKIGKNFLGPANPDGDIEGVILENNQVKTPASYKECWNKFVEDGWFSLDSPPEYYGMGLPNHVAQAVMEFFHGANFAFICYVLLTTGNAHLINNFASRKLKDIFCEKMYTGIWAGAMALTESNFGSDINLLATRAVPDGETYKIKGTKIFITGGDHDLTENIIHLLLARVEGDPEGAKGVSLFVVPKIWVREDGSLGDPNDVTVVSTEHKMGIHGSSTCTLNFGDENNCRAYLVGERGMGLSYMFQMMNESRMACAVESIGLLTNAYENCAAYAKERVQGFAFASKGGQRVRIIEHADIRRMLMNLKAASEGMRAMTMKAYYLEEVGHNDPDEKLRKKSKEQYDLLIPLCKAYCSDLTYKLMADAIQILGGYGFTSDFPVEQFARDVKITSIWEGTNYIQSQDLAVRKLNMKGGEVFDDWAKEISQFARAKTDDPDLGADFERLSKALNGLIKIRRKYEEAAKGKNINLIPLTSLKFLNCMAEITISRCFLEQAIIAGEKLSKGKDTAFYQGKILTAKYYLRNFLPLVFGRFEAINLEDFSPIEIPEEAIV